MPRIIYYAFPSGSVQGGIKMTLRHVETLRELGFDAVFATSHAATMPAWMDYACPVLRNPEIRREDVLVLPEDGVISMGKVANRRGKTIILCQNQFILGALATEAIDNFAQTQPLTFLTVGRIQTALLARLYPQALIERTPCFADERRFAPQAKTQSIAFMPKKRPLEPRVIRGFFRKLHPDHAGRAWLELSDTPEAQVAEALGRSDLFLSLSRFESVGMAALEAMASGCVCAGFTGIAGADQEYATEYNGFWAPEDDCEAAAHALAQAADLVRTGGPALKRHLDAGAETARQWSYARFRPVLEEVWMRLAPEARLRNGPLD